MLGSATLSQPKIDTLRAVLGKYVGQELDSNTQAAVASELSAKLGTKVSANEIPSLIRGYAAVAERLDAQDAHQAQVSSDVGPTLTASSNRDDHRSRWNPRGAVALQLARLSNTAALPGNTCVSAREQLLPIIAAAKEALAKNGVATGWLDDAVRAISDEVTDINALRARAKYAVELDTKRTGSAPETLASARESIADTTVTLAFILERLSIPTSGLLLELEHNPTAHADAADVALVQCKERLDEGLTGAAGQMLARFDKEMEAVDELLQEATLSVANHAANREALRRTGRELDRAVDEHLELMPRLRRQYAETVLTKLDGVEADLNDAIFVSKDALHNADRAFAKGAVIGASRALKAADEAFESIRVKLDAIREVTSALSRADQNNAMSLQRVERDYDALASRASNLTLGDATSATLEAALAAVRRSSAALGASRREPYDVASMLEAARLAVQRAGSAVTIEVAQTMR